MPVQQKDWVYTGRVSTYYVDTCLLFGLWSAPFLFNQLADAIHWILQNNYEVQHLLHYLDDFLQQAQLIPIFAIVTCPQ